MEAVAVALTDNDAVAFNTAKASSRSKKADDVTKLAVKKYFESMSKRAHSGGVLSGKSGITNISS